MIFSEQAYQREIKTLERHIAKTLSELEKSWWHLSCQSFQCKADAEKAINALAKTLKYHQVHTTLKEITTHSRRGVPPKIQRR